MFYVIRCTPISAHQVKIEYEVYRHKDASDEEFHGINNFVKAILEEDKDLCNGVQKNLEAGIFTSGELHHKVERVRQSSILA